MTLDDQEKRLLSVRRIRCAGDQRRSKETHVGTTFVPAQTPVAVCAKDILSGHLHSIQGVTDELWDLLVLSNASDSAF